MAKSLWLAEELRNHIRWVKVGLEGIIRYGPIFTRELIGMGLDVMLDVKAYDTPRTVVAATKRAMNVGAKMMTIHASCSKGTIKQAVESCGSIPVMRIIAVTVLTSVENRKGTSKKVYNLANKAIKSGAHGVVCASSELKILNKLGGWRIVPGIRRVTDNAEDQKRIATPYEAIQNGATHIVIGRPITQADDPVAETKKIIEEMCGNVKSA